MNKLIHYIIFCSLFFTACSEETLPKDTPVSPDGKGVEIILNLAPVSYTHLDVYKRQGYLFDLLHFAARMGHGSAQP